MRATLAGASRGRLPSFPHLPVSAIIPFLPNPGFVTHELSSFFFHSSELRSFLRVSTRQLGLAFRFPRPAHILPSRNCCAMLARFACSRDKPYQGTVAIHLYSYSTVTIFLFLFLSMLRGAFFFFRCQIVLDARILATGESKDFL